MSHSINPTQGKQDAGFLLIDMLVVVVLLSLVAFFAFPILRRSSPDQAVDRVAITIVSELKAAQAAARKFNRAQNVTIDLDARRMTWGQPRRTTALPHPLVISVRGVEVAADAGRTAIIRFNHDGSSNGGVISVRARSRTATVRTEWLTGETRLERID